jgi:hypothetical protein
MFLRHFRNASGVRSVRLAAHERPGVFATPRRLHGHGRLFTISVIAQRLDGSATPRSKYRALMP